MAGIDWEAVAKAYAHPLNMRLMVRAAFEPAERFTVAQLAAEWGEGVGSLEYAVRQLESEGLLLAEADGPTRYYRAAAKLVV